MTDNKLKTEEQAGTVPAAPAPAPTGVTGQSAASNEGGSTDSAHQNGYQNHNHNLSHGNNANKPYVKNHNNNRGPYNNQNSNQGNQNPNHKYPNSTGPRKQHYPKVNYNQNAYNPYHQMYPNYYLPPFGNYPPNVQGYNVGTSPQQQYAHLAPGQPPVGAPGYSPYPQAPGASKVKVSTKDGKPIDLQEKKKNYSSHPNQPSPGQVNQKLNDENKSVSAPVAKSDSAPVAHASPASAPAAAPAVSSPKPTVTASTPAPAPAPVANSIAEDFKRKIRERAEKLAAAKKEAAEKEAAEKAAKEPKVEEKPEVVAEPKVAETSVEEPKIAKPKTVDAKPEELKPVESAEPAKVTEPVKSVEETKPAESEKAKTEPEVSEIKKEDVTETNEESKSESEPKALNVEKIEDDNKSDVENDAENDDDEDDDEEDDELAGFTISNFLEKLATATPIVDPYSAKYPENINGADISKKLPQKTYRYDPQFLYQFKDVVRYRKDDDFQAILDKAHVSADTNRKQGGKTGGSKYGSGSSSRFGSGQIPRGQLFDKQNSRSGSKRRGGSSSTRDKSSRKNQSRRSGRESREDEMMNSQITIPKDEIKPLEKSATRWVPRSLIKKDVSTTNPDGSEILLPEDIERKVKSLLNKLTLEMFETITGDVLAIANQSKFEKDAKTVRQVIQLTFAKACDEPHWSEMYARFCAKLCTTLSNEVLDETMTLKAGNHPSGGDLARRLLLAICQSEYEKGWSDKLPTNDDGTPLSTEMMSDEYYIMAAAKRRGLGLVKFIGHLFNLNMLNDNVIYTCINDQCKNIKDPSEDSLENLVQLVKTVGPKLDRDERSRAILKVAFDYIQIILNEVKIASRIKFSLMDLQDLKRNRWRSSKGEAGPKTIEEIHRDAEKKKFEEQKLSNDKRQNRRPMEGRSGSSRSGSSWNNNNHNNNNNNTSNNSFLNNLKKSSSSSSFSAVPRSNSNVAAAKAAELERESSKRSESTHTNRFAALNDEEEQEEEEEEQEEEEEEVQEEVQNTNEETS